MIENFLDYIQSAGKLAVTSLSSASVGTILSISNNNRSIEIGFQHAAWTIAILAGIVAIVNGVDKFYQTHYKKIKNDEKL